MITAVYLHQAVVISAADNIRSILGFHAHEGKDQFWTYSVLFAEFNCVLLELVRQRYVV